MRRFIIGLSCAAIISTCAPRSSRPEVISSFYPVQLFALNVLKNTGITPGLLLPPELGCPHDYALTPGDVERLSAAKAVIINGIMEEFITTEKMRAVNPSIRIIDMSKGLALIRNEGHDEHHDGGYNPHTWVSPIIAAKQVRTLGSELASLFPDAAPVITANAEAYAERLEDLAREIRTSFSALPAKKIITFHDAFEYFARDLGLSVIGVIELDPGAAPSAKHIAELSALAKKHRVGTVFAEVQYPAAMANTVAKESGARIRTIDTFASGRSFAFDRYETVMRSNAAVIADALKETAPR